MSFRNNEGTPTEVEVAFIMTQFVLRVHALLHRPTTQKVITIIVPPLSNNRQWKQILLGFDQGRAEYCQKLTELIASTTSTTSEVGNILASELNVFCASMASYPNAPHGVPASAKDLNLLPKSKMIRVLNDMFMCATQYLIDSDDRMKTLDTANTNLIATSSSSRHAGNSSGIAEQDTSKESHTITTVNTVSSAFTPTRVSKHSLGDNPVNTQPSNKAPRMENIPVSLMQRSSAIKLTNTSADPAQLVKQSSAILQEYGRKLASIDAALATLIPKRQNQVNSRSANTIPISAAYTVVSKYNSSDE